MSKVSGDIVAEDELHCDLVSDILDAGVAPQESLAAILLPRSHASDVVDDNDILGAELIVTDPILGTSGQP